jgi:hypothetical protein
MRRKDGMRFYVREFLNKPHNYAGAYVLLSVRDSSLAKDDDHAWTEIGCEIADCNERIHLQFDLDSAKDRSNSIAKADMLVRVFTEFAAAMRLEAVVAAEREKRVAKRRAQEKRDEDNGKESLPVSTRLRRAIRRARL